MSGSNQPTDLKFVVTNTLIVRDIQRSVAFYRHVLGATVLREVSRRFCGSAVFGSPSTAAAARPMTSLRSSLLRRTILTFLASF